jgi:hemerythrin
MAFFVWKDGFCTGIDAVDAQHRAFLQCLNECHESLTAKQGAGIDPELATLLQGYAATHFQLEEALMRSMNYPGVAAHADRHRFFEHQVSELDRETGKATAGEMLIFLRDWFLRHILEEDRRFVPYVKFTGLP